MDVSPEKEDEKKGNVLVDVTSSSTSAIPTYPLEMSILSTFGAAENIIVTGKRISSGDYCVRVKHVRGPLPAWIQVQVFGPAHKMSNLRYSTEARSIVNPAEIAHAGLLAVGAANYMPGTPPAVVPNTIADYSSRGPLPVCLPQSTSGPGPTPTPTPGPSPTPIYKPDIIGISNTDSLAEGMRAGAQVALQSLLAAPASRRRISVVCAPWSFRRKRSGTAARPRRRPRSPLS